MLRALPVLTVFTAVLLSGIVHGVWTNRWTVAEEPAAARLSALPITLGDWYGQASKMNPREIALAEVAGYARRHYVNLRTGSDLSLLILCGRPGPISVHTPEICYPGAGYEQIGAPAKQSLASVPQAPEFWVYKFHKRDSAVPVNLRVLYSWSATGSWTAADKPRIEFARYPVLYKMYVIRQLPRADEPLDEDPSLEFLRVLMPELQKSLFSAP